MGIDLYPKSGRLSSLYGDVHWHSTIRPATSVLIQMDELTQGYSTLDPPTYSVKHGSPLIRPYTTCSAKWHYCFPAERFSGITTNGDANAHGHSTAAGATYASRSTRQIHQYHRYFQLTCLHLCRRTGRSKLST